MASSLIGGLIADGWNPASIRVSDTDKQQLARLTQRFPITTTTDNKSAVEGADVVVLAVKPQVMQGVAQTLAAALSKTQPLVISIAAGISESTLRRWLGEETAIVRSHAQHTGHGAERSNRDVCKPERDR